MDADRGEGGLEGLAELESDSSLPLGLGLGVKELLTTAAHTRHRAEEVPVGRRAGGGGRGEGGGGRGEGGGGRGEWGVNGLQIMTSISVKAFLL